MPKFRHSYLDSLRLYLKAGTGGNGFEKYRGVGGRGGNVWLCGSRQASFMQILRRCPSKRYLAKNGSSARLQRLVGEDGEDLTINVPLGVTALLDSGKVLGEINKPREKVIVAAGGKGGDATNNWIGQAGSAVTIRLDLKLLADIGLVGFPNAGKSTLLSCLSRARPKIASYPFTTVRPLIGTIEYSDRRKISMADLPGLIEGASRNLGMGHKFLRHVERTKVLVFVLDIVGFKLGLDYPFRSNAEVLMLLIKELELYNKELLAKPSILVINKIDELEESFCNIEVETLMRLVGSIRNKDYNFTGLPIDYLPESRVNFLAVLPMSAKTLVGIENLKAVLRDIIDTSVQETESAITIETIINRENFSNSGSIL